MPRSIWKLHIGSTSEESAKEIANRCIKLLCRPPMASFIVKYSKGGYMATLEFYQYEKLSWPELVYEVKEFS